MHKTKLVRKRCLPALNKNLYKFKITMPKKKSKKNLFKRTVNKLVNKQM